SRSSRAIARSASRSWRICSTAHRKASNMRRSRACRTCLAACATQLLLRPAMLSAFRPGRRGQHVPSSRCSQRDDWALRPRERGVFTSAELCHHGVSTSSPERNAMGIQVINPKDIALREKKRTVVMNTRKLHAWVHYYPNPGDHDDMHCHNEDQ